MLYACLPFLSRFPSCTAIPWNTPWHTADVFDQFTVWAPPIEMAAQTLTWLLNAWIERPHTTAAVILLPRVMQRRWQRMSRYLRRVSSAGEVEGTDDSLPLDRADHPLDTPRKDAFDFTNCSGPIYHCLPVCVLYLAPHVPSLPDPSLESPACTIPWRKRHWYQHQKDLLYGL